LRYAEDLVANKHPLANDVLALTHRCIEGRFGGIELTVADRRDFEQRVKAIRTFKNSSLEARETG
jgi:hypothetical protein